MTTAASSRPAAAETIPTPEEIAAEIFSEVTIGAHLDPRMTRREIANWSAEGIAVIAAALRAAEERGARGRWLPIAEALKDGAEIIYRREDGEVGRCRWDLGTYEDDEPEWWDIDSDQPAHPAFYIPMPALTPPAQDGGSETQEDGVA